MKLFGNEPKHGKHGETPEIEVTEIRSDDVPAQPEAGRKRKPRRWLYALGAVLLALAAAFAVYAIWERPPELGLPLPQVSPPPDGQGGGSGPAEAPAATPDPGEAPAVQFASERKDGVYTIMLVGRDFASNSTDTILIGSFDTVQHTISCVSIPRDTLINISWASTPKKINAVFPGFINSGGSGVEGLKDQIKNLLGFDVDCYAVVTLEAVVQAVDAIGGVWFDVPQDMFYWDPAQNLAIEIYKGYQLLDGKNALKLCRFRDGYAGGDIQRIGVQQELLKALAGQMLTLGNIPNLGTLIDILVANVDTDLSAANLAWFARQFLLCDMSNISFQTAPFSNGCELNGVSFVSLDVDAWLGLVNASLNPYKDAVTASNINILTSNGSGSYLSATNGVIAGGPDSFYCQPCTIANGGKSVYHAPGAHPTAAPPEETPSEETPPPAESETPEETPPAAPEEGATPVPTDPTPPAETPQIETVIVPPATE